MDASAGLSRAFSVDDLVGGIWRLQNQQAGGQTGGGLFGRTDSEAAFQEFLKRIPSATNLAAAASGQYEPQQLQQQAQQLLASGAGSAAANAIQEANGGVPGMPRVPSLDLLRQLVIQNQLQQGFSAPSSVVKSESIGGTHSKRRSNSRRGIPLLVPCCMLV